MQLRITTDYAIRSILYLAMSPGNHSSYEIADTMCIPQKYVQQIMRDLRIAGIITSAQGGNGGYALAREPEEIKLGDIIVVMEKTICLNRCLEEDHYCSRGGPPNCPVHKYYGEIQGRLEEYFAKVSIKELLEES